MNRKCLIKKYDRSGKGSPAEAWLRRRKMYVFIYPAASLNAILATWLERQTLARILYSAQWEILK